MKEQLKLSLEQAMLVAIARPLLTPAQGENLRRRAREKLNWNLVADLAAWHGLTPMLARQLNKYCADLVPGEMLGDFTSRAAANARRSISAGIELTRLVARLKIASLEAIPFKGPAQAVQLYDDISLREFADLDLLIRPEQALAAHRVLTEAGYIAEVAIAPGQQALYMRSECDRVYVHPETGTQVELHWALTPPYFGIDLSAAELIERARPVELAGRAIKTVSDEDLLIVLCINGAKEMWEKLEWISALAVLLDHRPALDWKLIDELTFRTGGRRMLLIGLGLAADMLDAKMPATLYAELARDRVARRLMAEAKGWLFADHFQGLKPWQITRFRLRARERVGDRVRYGWRRVFTPTHEDLALLPQARGLVPFYYVLRPLRLAYRLVQRRSSDRAKLPAR
jgi:hypothetical protein